MSAERTASLCVRGRPEDRRWSSPARPSALNRRTHFAPTALVRPARSPASVAESDWVAQHRGHDPGTLDLANGGRLRARQLLDLLLFRRREGA